MVMRLLRVLRTVRVFKLARYSIGLQVLQLYQRFVFENHARKKLSKISIIEHNLLKIL